MKTEINDVVTVYGSFPGGDLFSPRSNTAVAEMTASMLDQGTVRRDKFDISNTLEVVGASLSFRTGTYRVRFTAQCLSKDVPMVVELLAEQLREPAMHAKDLETAKRRRIGGLTRSKEDTFTRAMSTFLQELYPDDHPNFFVPVDRQIRDTEGAEVKDVKKFHRENYGRGDFTLVAVGDVDRQILEDAVEREFSGWKKSPLSVQVAGSVRAKKGKGRHNQVVTMRDKTSIDVIMGQPIGIDREHEDFYPLMVGHFVLGGNFSSRLMAVVRDELGLTYATGSTIGGVDNGNDGFWYILGTYSPGLLEQGHQCTMEQLEEWISEGVTSEELARKKTTITGSYKVSLATTGGLAGRILVAVERGKQLSHIDEYPQQINAVSLEEVNQAIKTYSHSGKLVTIAAGAIDGDWKALEG
ncbi:MAG: pitrilysin family protein [Candidatus Neomarinimicrobiota bacterium]